MRKKLQYFMIEWYRNFFSSVSIYKKNQKTPKQQQQQCYETFCAVYKELAVKKGDCMALG